MCEPWNFLGFSGNGKFTREIEATHKTRILKFSRFCLGFLGGTSQTPNTEDKAKRRIPCFSSFVTTFKRTNFNFSLYLFRFPRGVQVKECFGSPFWFHVFKMSLSIQSQFCSNPHGRQWGFLSFAARKQNTQIHICYGASRTLTRYPDKEQVVPQLHPIHSRLRNGRQIPFPYIWTSHPPSHH